MRIKNMFNNMSRIHNKKENEKGFVLLAAVLFLSIALGTGVFVGARILRSTSRVTRTDTASKVYSGAEGGAEAFIVLPDSYLDKYLPSNLSTSDRNALCDTYGWTGYTDEDGLHGCEVKYVDPTTSVETVAKVSVNSFKVTEQVNGSDGLTFYLDEGNTQEVVLSRGGTDYQSNLNICWDDDSTHLYMIAYNENGILDRKILVPENANVDDYDTRLNSNIGPHDPKASDMSGLGMLRAENVGGRNFPDCIELEAPFFSNLNPTGIRLRSLRGSTTVGIVPNNNQMANFPVQGFLIRSKAELSSEGITKSVKTVRVYKSVSFLPNIFDYAIYSEGSIVN
jgi:hypothetical protein